MINLNKNSHLKKCIYIFISFWWNWKRVISGAMYIASECTKKEIDEKYILWKTLLENNKTIYEGKNPWKKMLINGDHCNLFRVKASLIRQSINSYTFLIYWQLVLFAYLAFFLFKRLLFTYRYCIYNLYYMYI